VVPRHAGLINQDRGLSRSTEHVLADGEGDFAVADDEPTNRRQNGAVGRRRRGTDLSDKTVAVPVNRADVPRRACGVVDRRAKLGDETRQRRVRYESRPPERLVNLVLRQRSRPCIEEKLQKRKQLRATVDDGTAARQLATRP